MKKLILTCYAAMLTTFGIAQSMYTVNSNTNFSADFDNLQTAINTVPAGSVLIVQGSSINYGHILLSKQLIILGPGYHLQNQPDPLTQADKMTAATGRLRFSPGSQGSIVSGMMITGNVQLDTTSNILLESNRISGYLYSGRSNSCVIAKNYFDYSGAGTTVTLEFSDNITFRNNIVFRPNPGFLTVGNSGGSQGPVQVLAEYNTFACNNSTATATLEAFRCVNITEPTSLTMRNNIIVNLGNSPAAVDFSVYGPPGNGITFSFHNNVISDGSFPGNTACVYQIAPAALFAHLGSTRYDFDYKVQNASGSPATGAGTGATTCGAYGGPDPYAPSGLNLIPNIYELQVPAISSTTQGINIHIKARANQ